MAGTSIHFRMTVLTFVFVISTCSLPLPLLGTVTSYPDPTPPSPCVEDRDPKYDGVRVNCQSQNISSLPLPAHWVPMATSSLLLDYNSLVYLNQTSFSTFPTCRRLRLLGLSYNSISHIEPFTFSNFVSLDELDLQGNFINLDQNSFSGHVFYGLDDLSLLKLTNNSNKDHKGSYPNSLLASLHNLRWLELDTFWGDLNFSNIFHATTRLSQLHLSGGMTTIKNESFDCFSSINLTTLHIQLCDVQHTETGAFRHLRHLQSYQLTDVAQGPRDTLQSLAPFARRNMTHLIFRHLHYDTSQPSKFQENSVLTVHTARYLSQICVENVAMMDCGIFVIEKEVIDNPVWIRCLRTLDLSGNRIVSGYRDAVYIAPKMHRVEVFKCMNWKYSYRHYKSEIWKPPSCPCKVNSVAYDTLKIAEGIGTRRFRRNYKNISHTDSEISQISLPLGPCLSALPSRSLIKPNNLEEEIREFQASPSSIYYYLPKHLKILAFNGIADYLNRFDERAHYVNGDNLEELHLSDTGSRKFSGSYTGLTNLKVLDFSKNIGSLMSPSFFNGFSSVVHLNMAEMNLDYSFMAQHSHQLFLPLIHLSTLILSRNDLRGLSNGTFEANSELRVLLLAGNRFESIPFDLRHVPHLCWLDLRGNALRELSHIETSKLDRHSDKVPAFYLNLDGNPFNCGCQSLQFLSWLKRTHINLDKQGNYSCILDSGIGTTTGEMQDLDAMWRKCNGETSFLISLFLLCFMISGFFLFIVTCKFITQLKAFLLRKFWPPFVMKTPADYAIGVYIGYADQDRNLACLRIRQFIEDELGLSTYIRHRDLLPASDMAEAIVEAVHSSWRVIFVVSNHFLTDPWSYFALKTSTYAAQVENPGRIVLIVIDGEDHNETVLCQVPTSVLRAVQEQSIVSMSSRGQISYEDKQALVTALLYHGTFFDD